jgi:hypothetical protein
MNRFNNGMEGTVKLTSLVAVALLISTTVVFAQSRHPIEIALIDEALKTAKITPAQRSQVIKYRNEGELMHSADQHGLAEVAIQKARDILHM